MPPTAPGAEAPAERVGIFGGTFDPPHRGHVTVAGAVADALDLRRVLWIPAGRPPHKPGGAVSPAESRLAMVAAAVAADPRFEVDAREVRRPGPSFTVDTLEELRRERPGAQLFLILGEDQVRAFDDWRDPEGIVKRARVAVIDREGRAADAALPAVLEGARARGRVSRVPVPRVDVSSSAVRAALRAGGDPARLLPEAVADVVRREGLYRT